jgi:hypothetical protein
MTTIANNDGAMQTTGMANIIDNTTGNTYSFPFNINQLEWNYTINTQSFDTIGGRVVQLLSVQVTTMQIQGEAGNRSNMLQFYDNFKTVQDNQNQQKVSATFNVPSRNLSFKVWLETMQIGWDYTTVTYPYSITFEVENDISGTATNAATATALSSMINDMNGIGFSSQWTGIGNASTVNTNLPLTA